MGVGAAGAELQHLGQHHDLWRIGRKEEAREMFESVLENANHLGLLSEDLDPESGQLWGNFPQTYSMAGIINSAHLLSRDWPDVV